MKFFPAVLLFTLALTARGVGALPEGANVLPYEIHNTESGKEYCQMCAYSERPATIAVYGNLRDEQFWSDLAKLQKVQKDHPNFGFFGQVLDSTDSKTIQELAKKHGVTFPVVYAIDPDWESVYRVGKVSRTIYYSTQFKIGWSGIGLDDHALAAIEDRIKSSPQS